MPPSILSRAVWRGGATKSGQSSYLHLRLVRHIRESESSSSACGKTWPTPTRRDYKGGGSHGYSDREGQKPDDEQPDGRGSGCVWRTPDANMTRGAISEAKYIEREKSGLPNALNYQVAHTERLKDKESCGQLNPAWVEQLMGYPDGWSDPDCETPALWQGWPARPGEAQFPFEHPRTVVGMPNRAKRLKALGNSVVPQQAEPIFRAIQFINRMVGKDGVKYE